MKTIRSRPFLSSDAEILDHYRAEYKDGVLEIPYGYDFPPFVETIVATREDGSLVAAMTASMMVVLDFIPDPNANNLEIAGAMRRLLTAIEYSAQKAGAIEVVAAAPDHLKEYHSVFDNQGWSRTAPDCFIFRKSLLVGGAVPTGA